MKKIFLSISTLFLLLGLSSCKKDYLETRPSNGVTIQDAFSKINAILSSMDGITKEQFASGIGGNTGHDNFGQKSYDLMGDLMGNDMVVHSQGYGWFNADYQYSAWQTATDASQSYNAWYFYYDIIKQANIVLANVDGAKDASVAQIESVKGQALGLRAYAYYYLINLFQQTYKGNESKPGVPVYLQASTVGAPRKTVADVYAVIVADLTQAETLLANKTRPAGNKSQVDVSVVRGLRARVALLMEDWATVASYAKLARQNYPLMTTAQYTAVNAFSDVTNPEWIWGSDIAADQATIYASFFSHMDIRTGGYAALGGQKKITKALYDQIPAGDIRKSVFTPPSSTSTTNPPYNQVKHQVPSTGADKWAADYLYMRSSEMYLLEAEALARQGQDANARTVLETLVKARFPAYTAAAYSGPGLIAEILVQRRIELWGEGFSLIDIKRLKTGLNRPSGAGNHGAPNFSPAIYTTGPDDARFLMRIPQKELNNNTNMTPADQNP